MDASFPVTNELMSSGLYTDQEVYMKKMHSI